MCTLITKSGKKAVLAVVSDARLVNGGYTYTDARNISATAQFDGENIKVSIGDIFVADGVRYRIGAVTRTMGDASVTVSLVVEGRQ